MNISPTKRSRHNHKRRTKRQPRSGGDHYSGSVAGDNDADRLRKLALKRGAKLDRKDRNRFKLDNFWFRIFPNRNGYNEDFLGARVDLPRLTPALAKHAAPRVDDPNKSELEYTNFSIVQHKERRMPIFTAVNIDGKTARIIRDDEDWSLDGRLSGQHQMGNAAYRRNPLDRGHMVHGQSAASGPKAAQAREDTYTYTNAALQHEGLNKEEWVDLENQLMRRATRKDQKMTVFAGPVFRDDDPVFNNNGRMRKPTKLPRDFWKVIVWNHPEQGLQHEAYLMSQAEDLTRKDSSYNRYEGGADLTKYRVSLDKIEQLTGLEFDRFGRS